MGRSLKVAGYSFQYFSRLKSLMGHYNHSILVDAKIMVSTSCPIIGEQVAVNFVAQQLTIATIWPAKNNSKMSSVTPIFYYRIVISMIRCNFLQSLKEFCEGG